MTKNFRKLYLFIILLSHSQYIISRCCKQTFSEKTQENPFRSDDTMNAARRKKLKKRCRLLLKGNLCVDGHASVKDLCANCASIEHLHIRGNSITTNGITEYAYIYNTTTDNIDTNADISFDTNSILTSGILHTPSSTTITVNTAGTYLILFCVTTEAIASAFALTVNNVPVVSTVYAATVQNNGIAILSVNSGDVLTLRNVANGVFLAQPTSASSITASIVLQRIGK